MLKKITLENFMSHKNTVIDLSKCRNIAVVGDVGSGKSALLEAILFAFYGEGRTSGDARITYSQLIAIGSEKMKVKLSFDIDNVIYTITRVRNSSGTGTVSVEQGEELVASGSKAQEFINKLLCVDSELFKLTSFFGAGESDKIMECKPSERMDTIQKIANAVIFSEFGDLAHKFFTDRNKQLIQVDTQIETHMLSVGILPDLIKSKDIQIKKLDKLIEKEARVKEKQIEIKLVLTSFNESFNKRKSIFDRLNGVENQLCETVENISAYLIQKDKCENLVLSLQDKKLEICKDSEIENVGDIQKKYSSSLEKKTEFIAMKNLLTAGINVATHGVSNCPLCESELSKTIVKSWSERITKLESDICSIDTILESASTRLSRINNIKDRMHELDLRLATELSKSARCLENYEHETSKAEKLTQQQSELSVRLKEIDIALKECSYVLDDLEEVENNLHEINYEIGALKSDIKNTSTRIKDVKETKAIMTKEQTSLESLKKDIEALNLLKKAFSRYGIPLDLIHNLCDVIGEESTNILNFFMDGVIELSQTDEKGKPGIEFILSDSSGTRKYIQLSRGQRVIVGMSVRIAVAFLLKRELNIPIDFIVLDEVAGNLDDTKRSDLISLICKFLQKHYSQLFTASHAKLKNVFTDIFETSLIDGCSQVRVI